VGAAPKDSRLVPRRALLSAFEPEAFLPLAQGLEAHGVELWASSGTQMRLSAAGVKVRSTEGITGISSWFGHRVATLHPLLFGGILAPRTPEGEAELKQRGALPFDLVGVIPYPFEEELARGTPTETLVERIDVGGPSLLRAAAKNYRYVAALTDPTDIAPLLHEMKAHQGGISLATRERLAAKAFRRTALHDVAIASWLSRLATGGADEGNLPVSLLALSPTREEMRYGENPHQRGRLLELVSPPGVPLRPWPLEQLKGDALSYNNYLDLDRSLALVGEFPTPTASVVKHATPCGVASGKGIAEALAKALDTDPIARYGCALALNGPMDLDAVDVLKGTFVDILVGPEFPPEVLARLEKRPKLKLVRATPPKPTDPAWEARTATGRFLLQEIDGRMLKPGELRAVTKRTATPEELCALDFAWRVVRHAKSNAVVLAAGSRTVGIGAGQTSRVGAVRCALEVAGPRAKGAVLASDAYFPFADGIEEAGKAGVRAIVQPGGSIRDPEVVESADRAGIAMYFTGWRVFRH
jgi:phosphoribosylaminoimidazolecarboxamide formyltransferase / IMP cyclohydrolase